MSAIVRTGQVILAGCGWAFFASMPVWGMVEAGVSLGIAGIAGILIVAFGLGAAVEWKFQTSASALRRLARRRRGQCPECGYDLRGRPRGGCPECGAENVPASTPTDTDPR